MPNLPIAVKVAGSDYVSTEVELQRSNTEASLKANGQVVLFDDDLSSLVGWTQNVSYGTVSVETEDSKTYFKNTITTGYSGSRARAEKKTGVTFGKRFRVDTSINIAVLGSTFNYNELFSQTYKIWLDNGEFVLYFEMSRSSFRIWDYNGGSYYAGAFEQTLSLDTWYDISIDVSYTVNTAVRVEVFLNGKSVGGTTTATWNGGTYTSGYLKIEVNGNNKLTSVKTDFLRVINTSASFPKSSVVSLRQIDSGSNSTIWDMSTITSTENPNGESGTIKYKYAYADSAIPAYGKIDTLTIDNAGADYEVDDELTVIQGTNTTAKIKVLTVSSGAIDTWEFVDKGCNYTTASGLSLTGGSGASATCDITVDNSMYNADWLTLAKIKTETDPTSKFWRLACQLSGNGSQDATITDASITANVATGGGSKPTVFFC